MSKKESAIINEIDKARLKLSIEHYIKYFIGKRTSEINKDEALNAIALAVREFAMDKMYETMARYNKVNSKRIYYLSIEYLIGRSLENNLHNLGLFNILKSIKIDGMPDISLQEIFDAEYDPALGNGGLGRLAACFLDGLATESIPAIWTQWRRSASRVSATASTISSACLSRNLKTAIRLSRPTAGSAKTLRGSFPGRTARSKFRFTAKSKTSRPQPDRTASSG